MKPNYLWPIELKRSWRSRLVWPTAGITIFLAACGAPTKPPSQCLPTPSRDLSPTSTAFYATALERHQPLGRVAGRSRPLPKPVEVTDQFADAVAYAASQDSYALLIWSQGRFALERYFEGYDSELRPESASMHKSVLGLLVAAAIADGLFQSADQTIGRFIPEWADDPRGDITIRQLLTMSSGLKPLSREGGEQSPAVKFWMGPTDPRATLLELQQIEPVTGVFHYQNTVPQLMLTVLEAATGQSYAEYLSKRLWQPIGAGDAYLWLYEEEGFPRGFTALMARPRDWLRLGLLVKDRGSFAGQQIIPTALLDQATAASTANPNYGWYIWRGERYESQRYYTPARTPPSVRASAPYRADDMLFFDGFGGQRVYISQSRDLVIVRLGAMRMDWDDAELPNRVIAALDKQ